MCQVHGKQMININSLESLLKPYEKPWDSHLQHVTLRWVNPWPGLEQKSFAVLLDSSSPSLHIPILIRRRTSKLEGKMVNASKESVHFRLYLSFWNSYRPVATKLDMYWEKFHKTIFPMGNYASPGRLQTWGFDKVQALVSSGKHRSLRCSFRVGDKWLNQSEPQKKNVPGCWLHHWVVVSNIFLFSPWSMGKWSHCDEHIFQIGLVQPPTRWFFAYFLVDSYRLQDPSLFANLANFLENFMARVGRCVFSACIQWNPVEGTKNCLGVFVMFIQDLEDFPDAIGLKFKGRKLIKS